MQVNARATEIGVIAMSDGQSPNREATTQIRKQRYIELEKVRQLATFRPILLVSYNWQRPIADIVVIVKSELTKDGDFVWNHAQPQKDNLEYFYPNVNLFDLQNYQRRNDAAGTWQLKMSIAFMPGPRFEAIPGTSIYSYLLGQVRYEQIASFSWRVVQKIENVLTATGNLRHPLPNTRQLQEVAVSLDNL